MWLWATGKKKVKFPNIPKGVWSKARVAEASVQPEHGMFTCSHHQWSRNLHASCPLSGDCPRHHFERNKKRTGKNFMVCSAAFGLEESAVKIQYSFIAHPSWFSSQVVAKVPLNLLPRTKSVTFLLQPSPQQGAQKFDASSSVSFPYWP